MRVAIIGIVVLAVACVSNDGGSASEQRVRQAAYAGEPEAQELMGKMALTKDESCRALAWFEKAGAQGRGYSQMFAAVLLAFHTCSREPQGELRAYAWLTDQAIASRHLWQENHRLLFFKLMRTPPASARELDPKAIKMAEAHGMTHQELLESTQQEYADSRDLYDVPDLRPWLHARLTSAQIEAAMALRVTLTSKAVRD